VLGFSILKFGMGSSLESELANKMTLMDAQTGQLYIVDIGGNRGVLIPARRPESRELALLPVYEGDDGQWYLGERYRNMLGDLEVPTEAITSPDQPVRVSSDEPIKFKQ